MDNGQKSKKVGTACGLPDKNGVIKYIFEGMDCPNCGFAKLVREPGNIIKCPICGWGNGAGCT